MTPKMRLGPVSRSETTSSTALNGVAPNTFLADALRSDTGIGWLRFRWVTRISLQNRRSNSASFACTSPSFAASIKCQPHSSGAVMCILATRHTGQRLLETYLGRRSGQLVFGGKVKRGDGERVDAAIWYSDLRGYTKITDTSPPDEIIPLLNDYAAAAISAIRDAGGDVLKLIGDGVLAIFRADDAAQACRCALRAEASLRSHILEVNERRTADGRPVTSVYLGLHIGEVFYGNIGSEDRLDFTVVGPAVNETSRIASMCRSVDRPILISSAFAQALRAADRGTLVSVGRFALRGVGRAQDLFTLDPALITPV